MLKITRCSGEGRMSNVLSFPTNKQRRWALYEQGCRESLEGVVSDEKVEWCVEELKEAYNKIYPEFSIPLHIPGEANLSDQQIIIIENVLLELKGDIEVEFENLLNSAIEAVSGLLGKRLAGDPGFDKA